MTTSLASPFTTGIRARGGNCTFSDSGTAFQSGSAKGSWSPPYRMGIGDRMGNVVRILGRSESQEKTSWSLANDMCEKGKDNQLEVGSPAFPWNFMKAWKVTWSMKTITRAATSLAIALTCFEPSKPGKPNPKSTGQFEEWWTSFLICRTKLSIVCCTSVFTTKPRAIWGGHWGFTWIYRPSLRGHHALQGRKVSCWAGYILKQTWEDPLTQRSSPNSFSTSKFLKKKP